MSVKHKSQRVAVFVDVANMYYSAKNLYSAFVNFGAVLKEAVSGRQLIRASAYVIRADIEQEKSFFEALEKQGFEVRAKDLQVFPGGMKKGDWDVGICMDVIRTLPLVDVVVLVSGDGDYVDLVDYVKGQGRIVEAMAFGKTASAKLSDRVDEFLDLDRHSSRFLIRARARRRDSHAPRKV